MSDSSDDEFDFSSAGKKSNEKGKGKSTSKAKTQSAAQKKKENAFSLDNLLAESKNVMERKEKLVAGLDMEEVNKIIHGDHDKEKCKDELRATNEQAALAHEEALKDESISIPGVLLVFRPPQFLPGVCSPSRLHKLNRNARSPPPGLIATKLHNRIAPDNPQLLGGNPADLSFNAPCPRKELSVLFEALRRAAGDAADLEELLWGGLVMWVRQKQDGKAPPEVCRWLMQVLASHELSRVVLATEEALLQLLAEPLQVWKLRYEDTLHVWRSCGAVWLAEGTDDAGQEREREGDQGGSGSEGPVRRNLGPFLNVVESCLRRGAHDMEDEQLREMLLDLCAAAVDETVCGSCFTGVYRTIEAVVDSMSCGYYQDRDRFSALVDSICDPAARKLSSRMQPLSFVLLARNIPFKRSSLGPGDDGAGGCAEEAGGSERCCTIRNVEGEAGAVALSLRHEVCHRLLRRRFLQGTPYEEEDSLVGFSRTVKAIEVMLGDNDILKDDSTEGYARQYAVVSLANEMAGGALAVSENKRPDYRECTKLLGMVDLLNKQMQDVMQGYIQMCKTLLDMMKSTLSPYAIKSNHQATLAAFMKKPDGEGPEQNESDDESLSQSLSQSQ